MHKGVYIKAFMTDEQLRECVSAEDWQRAESMPAKRRSEHLSWRAMLYETLGQIVTIEYNEVGAPYIVENPNIYIGVSHGAERVAVAISDRACAIDIESVNRDFTRASSRYTTSDEELICEGDLALIWCAKETLYKLSGRSELNLKTDLRITSLDKAMGICRGQILDLAPVDIHYKRESDYIVTWSI